MTAQELSTYKILVLSSYVNYILELDDRSKVSTLDLKYEFDTKLWILGKAVGIILEYDAVDGNYYSASDMMKWQDIMNDIMKSKWYINFDIA